MDKPKRYQLVQLDGRSLVWPFNDAPYYSVQAGSRQRHEKIDPFPGYSHDPYLVNDTLKHVTTALPIDNVMDVDLTLLSHETVNRVNGYAWATKRYEDESETGQQRWHGQIVLVAKRTPIHPGMTKYLVAHEYGHLVQRAIEIANGLEEYAFEENYADMRGIPYTPASYGGGTWHMAPGELFANDFRLLVARVEREFWPHPDVPRPETLPIVMRFWESVARDFKLGAELRGAISSPDAPSTELALAV